MLPKISASLNPLVLMGIRKVCLLPTIRVWQVTGATRSCERPDIDFVVCATRVDRHLATIGASLKAGKDLYVEWPLGKSLAEAKELLHLKNEGVKRATVGLQGRQAPIIKKLKEPVEGGRIGKVLSSTCVAQGGSHAEASGRARCISDRRGLGGIW